MLLFVNGFFPSFQTKQSETQIKLQSVGRYYWKHRILFLPSLHYLMVVVEILFSRTLVGFWFWFWHRYCDEISNFSLKTLVHISHFNILLASTSWCMYLSDETMSKLTNVWDFWEGDINQYRIWNFCSNALDQKLFILQVTTNHQQKVIFMLIFLGFVSVSLFLNLTNVWCLATRTRRALVHSKSTRYQPTINSNNTRKWPRPQVSHQNDRYTSNQSCEFYKQT